MRKIIGVAVSCLVACSLFLTVQPAFGALSSPYQWTPDVDSQTSADSFVIELTLSSGIEIGLYDYDNNNQQLGIFPSETSELIERLKFFCNDDGTWDVAIESSWDESSDSSLISSYTKTLDLGGTNAIGFYLNEGSGPDDSYSISSQGGQAAVINWSTGENVATIGITNMVMSEVPIPTAMLLLSSGLVGLAGFKRKMDY